MLSAPDLSLLINAGVAGVFATFAIVLTREFMKYLGSQQSMWRELYTELIGSQKGITAELSKLTNIISILADRVEECPARSFDAIQKQSSKKVDVREQA